MILEIQCTMMWIDLPLNCTWKLVYLCYVEFPIFLALRESCSHLLSSSAMVWWAEVTGESALSLGSCFRFPGGKMSSYRSSSLSIRTWTHNNCTTAVEQVVITPNMFPPGGSHLSLLLAANPPFFLFQSWGQSPALRRPPPPPVLSPGRLPPVLLLEKSWQSLCGLSTWD